MAEEDKDIKEEDILQDNLLNLKTATWNKKTNQNKKNLHHKKKNPLKLYLGKVIVLSKFKKELLKILFILIRRTQDI